jgi:hypothetical protein
LIDEIEKKKILPRRPVLSSHGMKNQAGGQHLSATNTESWRKTKIVACMRSWCGDGRKGTALTGKTNLQTRLGGRKEENRNENQQ